MNEDMWIDVKERLPQETDTSVDFYNEVMVLQIGSVRPKFMKYWEVKNCPFTTHWASIPKRPKSTLSPPKINT